MRLRPLSALLALAIIPASTHASVIYDARLASPGSIFIIADPGESSSSAESITSETDWRVGDEITFAGTDRFVTSFSTRVQGFAGAAITLGVELSIYQSNFGLPGALIWSGASSPVLLSSGSAPIDVSFSPNMLLPDTVCFAISFPSIATTAGNQRIFGVVSAGDPAIGSSPVTNIHQLSADSTWHLRDDSLVSGGLFKGVDAHVVAVPVPASLAGLALLGTLTIRRRRP